MLSRLTRSRSSELVNSLTASSSTSYNGRVEFPALVNNYLQHNQRTTKFIIRREHVSVGTHLVGSRNLTSIPIRLSRFSTRLFVASDSTHIHPSTSPIYSILATLSSLFGRRPQSISASARSHDSDAIGCAYCNLSIPLSAIAYNGGSIGPFTAELLREIADLHYVECPGHRGFDLLQDGSQVPVVERQAESTSHSQNGNLK